MNCPSCGNKVNGFDSTCMYCGTQFRGRTGSDDFKKSPKKTINILLIAVLVFVLIFIIAPIAVFVFTPSLSSVADNMMVRSDITNARWIGRGVEVWQSDNMANNLDDKFVKYSELEGIETYVELFYEPRAYSYFSQEEGDYYVANIENDGVSNIVVAIGPNNLDDVPERDKTFNSIFNKNLSSRELEVSYDGSGSGIAYVQNSNLNN